MIDFWIGWSPFYKNADQMFSNRAISMIICNMLLPVFLMAQNNGLVLQGGFIVLSNGSASSPCYLVIDQSSPSGITRTAGHIISEAQFNRVKWLTGTGTGSFIVPFGYSNSVYLPFTFNKTSTSAADLTVSTWSSAADNTPWAQASSVAAVADMFDATVGGDGSVQAVIDRWWDIGASAAAVAGLTFTYRGSENTTTINPTGMFGAQRWNGSSWDAPVGSGLGVTSSTGTVSAAGVTSFSPYVLSLISAPLPITLITFDAACANGVVQVSWTTATEHNNNYFTIERSPDGISWSAIATVAGAGNSLSLVSYSFTDDHPLQGISYYRMKQTDYDGHEEYFYIRAVDCKGSSPSVVVYTDPSPGTYWVIASEEISALDVFDMLGQLVLRITDAHSASVPVHLEAYANGMYVINIDCSGKSFHQKVIKQ
jgi:hypothetical protein